MFKKDADRLRLDASETTQTPNTGFLRKFTSLFQNKSQSVLNENTGHSYLTEKETLDFWFQKQTFVNGLPKFANSTSEKQLAIRDVFQFLQTPALYESSTLTSSYKIILSDLNCLQIIINSFPGFFSTIPRSLVLDQQFIVSLGTHNPDALVIWSMSIFNDFTPIQLYDSIHNSLSSDWVLLQHFRDARVVVMKKGMLRKTIDLLDLWLLNLNLIAENSHKSKSFNEVQKRFFNLDFEPEVVQADWQVTSGFTSSPTHTSSGLPKCTQNLHTQIDTPNPFDRSKDDTSPSKHSPVSNSELEDTGPKPTINNLVYLSDCLVGKKCLLEHPNHGQLDIIVTGISDLNMEFVIISGPHIGRNSYIPKEVVSSCLVVGNEDSRILNTNIIQVKK